MNRVTIIFGEMGSGKTYYGKYLTEKIVDAEFFDGDSVATPEMIAKVTQFEFLTRPILEEYLEILFNTIADKAAQHKHLIVAQALYLDDDRKELNMFLKALGYDVEFFWTRPSVLRNCQQLLNRPNGWKWVYYWLMNKPFFQRPTHDYTLVR